MGLLLPRPNGKCPQHVQCLFIDCIGSSIGLTAKCDYFCRGVISIAVAVFCLKLVRYCMYMWMPMFLEKQVNTLSLKQSSNF